MNKLRKYVFWMSKYVLDVKMCSGHQNMCFGHQNVCSRCQNVFWMSKCVLDVKIRGLLEKYPTFGREKETGLLGALDT